MVDWVWSGLFSPNIVQLPTSRTGGVGLAHYAAGDYVIRKGDRIGNVYAIQSGTAGVYLDESAQPGVTLKPGDHIGVRSPSGRGVYDASVKAETPLDLITIRSHDFQRVAQTITSLRAMTKRSEAALAGYQALITMATEQPRLASLIVRDVMSQAETLPPDISLRDAVKRFSTGNAAYLILDQNGKLEGYCGRTELFSALRSGRPLDTQMRDFMRRDSPVVLENQTVLDASVMLLREDIDLLPVATADGSGRIAGVMSPFDVILKAMEPGPAISDFRDKPGDRKLAS
jgi:signal-transduction protein with cAMP-binding, CBS, and nucleotidyltransferase domain